MAVVSAGEEAGVSFLLEGFVQGRMWPPLFAGTDWNHHLFSMTQYPSLPTSPVCSAGVCPLTCFVTRKTITAHVRPTKLWGDNKPHGILVFFYKFRILLLMNACHSGELVVTQEQQSQIGRCLFINVVCLFLPFSGKVTGVLSGG